MNSDIIRMANDIATFHNSFPTEEGVQLIAEHINKFWAPSLRTKLFDLLETHKDDFHPLVISMSHLVHCAERNPVDLTHMDRTGTGG